MVIMVIMLIMVIMVVMVVMVIMVWCHSHYTTLYASCRQRCLSLLFGWLVGWYAYNKRNPNRNLFIDNSLTRTRNLHLTISLNHKPSWPPQSWHIIITHNTTYTHTHVQDPAGLIRFTLSSLATDVPPMTDIQHVLMLECMKPAAPGPVLSISYKDSMAGTWIREYVNMWIREYANTGIGV